jgi:hypothetical protein
MDILASNLLFALRAAIADQRRVEREAGFRFDSTLLAGLEDLYKHIQRGGQIHIKHS